MNMRVNGCLSLSFLDTRLFDSKWVKIETGRGFTSLTIPNLYKDDEGLYTLRMVTKGGTAEHSAFISVAGEICLTSGQSKLITLGLRLRRTNG